MQQQQQQQRRQDWLKGGHGVPFDLQLFAYVVPIVLVDVATFQGPHVPGSVNWSSVASAVLLLYHVLQFALLLWASGPFMMWLCVIRDFWYFSHRTAAAGRRSSSLFKLKIEVIREAFKGQSPCMDVSSLAGWCGSVGLTLLVFAASYYSLRCTGISHVLFTTLVHQYDLYLLRLFRFSGGVVGDIVSCMILLYLLQSSWKL